MNKNQKTIILLMGASGSGKTTVSKVLMKKYGWKDIESYTTRPARHANEHGHVFITDTEFDKIKDSDMCAYTLYNGHRYCATNAQADQADIYVIDPAGVKEFKKRYRGIRTPIVVYLETSSDTRRQRMEKRGDTDEMIDSRLQLDDEAFKEAEQMADITVLGTLKPDTIARRLYEISKGRI